MSAQASRLLTSARVGALLLPKAGFDGASHLWPRATWGVARKASVQMDPCRVLVACQARQAAQTAGSMSPIGPCSSASARWSSGVGWLFMITIRAPTLLATGTTLATG